LSEQMTVTLPRVSTAGSRRMMAFRRAMRDTPIASMIVMAAGRPSGIAPMARATATLNVYSQSLPRRMSMAKVAAARARITTKR